MNFYSIFSKNLINKLLLSIRHTIHTNWVKARH